MKRNEDWKTNRRKLTWNGEVVAWIVIQLSKGKNWEKIGKSYNRKFNHNTTGNYLYTKYRQTLLTGKVVSHKEHLTPEEEVFLNACFLNNFSVPKTLDGFEEQFGVRISEKQLLQYQKKLAIRGKIQHEKIVEKQIKKRVNNMKKGKWTAKEDKQLMACKNRQEVLALARKLKRSTSATEQRWYNARKTNKPKSSPEPRKKIKKQSKKTYTPRWTQEQDFDLLCNFYELSIDEARKRYNRTYSQIAGRLEKLVDSTKPKHISMLMEAAEAIKSRKEKDTKPVKLSRKEKRRAKKQAKKDKEIAKAQAKLDYLLDKIRGE